MSKFSIYDQIMSSSLWNMVAHRGDLRAIIFNILEYGMDVCINETEIAQLFRERGKFSFFDIQLMALCVVIATDLQISGKLWFIT